MWYAGRFDDRLQPGSSIDLANELLFGGIGRDLLKAQHRICTRCHKLSGMGRQDGALPCLIVVAPDPLQNQRRGRTAEPQRLTVGSLALLEHELTVGPGEDLEELRLE